MAVAMCVVLVLGLMPAGLAAQQAPPQPAAPATATEQSSSLPLPAPPPVKETDYIVGPQDVLKIGVFGEPTLTGSFRVDNDGTFLYPFVGRLKANGLTVAAIEADLKMRLSDGYIKDPQVSVQMEQYRSQNVFVMGEVRVPNRYSLAGNWTVVDALMQAGWVTATAGYDVLIVHPKGGITRAVQANDLPGINADVTHVNLRDIEAGRFPPDIRIQDGDTILVPKALRISVLGNVRSAGSLVYEPGMTIQAAIALAGGTTDKGSTRRIKIVRFQNNERKEIDVDLTDLVQPNDIVTVGQRLF